MTIVSGYATKEEAKTWVGISDTLDDTVIEQCVTAVSRGIDSYCKRPPGAFGQTASTARVFDADDGYCLEVDDVVSVSALATDEDYSGTFETVWSASDYQLLPLPHVGAAELRPYTRISAVGSRVFPCGYGSLRTGLVQVTGVWGWPAVPYPVRQACQMLASRLLQRRKSPEGVSGWGEFGPVRISSRTDPDVVFLLADLRPVLVQ